MLNQKTFYKTESFENNFSLDFARLKRENDCNGVLKIELLVPVSSVKLVVQDESEQYIREDLGRFVVESSTPIVSGKIDFKFVENENLSPNNSSKKAVVRYLYCG